VNFYPCIISCVFNPLLFRVKTETSCPMSTN
jgi:hypothetical protein